jgi:hypothetical protein
MSARDAHLNQLSLVVQVGHPIARRRRRVTAVIGTYASPKPIRNDP